MRPGQLVRLQLADHELPKLPSRVWATFLYHGDGFDAYDVHGSAVVRCQIGDPMSERDLYPSDLCCMCGVSTEDAHEEFKIIWVSSLDADQPLGRLLLDLLGGGPAFGLVCATCCELYSIEAQRYNPSRR